MPTRVLCFITCTPRNIQHQRVSRTNARVPKHEAIQSSKRLLSCLCNDRKASRSVRNSGLETSCSPCTRRNKLRYVWTASKSRRDFKRCERARRKRLMSWRVAKERISKSAAAGESDFAKVKNASSDGDVNVDPRQSKNTYNCHLVAPAIAFEGTRSLHLQQIFWIFSRMSSPFLFLEPQTVFQRPKAWAGKRAPSLEPLEALLAYFFANYPSSVRVCERKSKF